MLEGLKQFYLLLIEETNCCRNPRSHYIDQETKNFYGFGVIHL